MISDYQLIHVLQGIDTANACDPNIETNSETGQSHPKELLYSQLMSKVLTGFAPDASHALKIATRGHHIERWTSQRSDYPEGRAGYKKWRSELMLFHADRVGVIMSQHGCEPEDIDRVQFLIKKRKLRQDPETQCFEDIICLTFLKYYFDDFAGKHSDEKIVDIVQKTWKKMSEQAHDAALKMSYSPAANDLLKKALH